MKPGYKTTEFWSAAFLPWLTLLVSWVQTGVLDWQLLLGTGVLNGAYAVSRGMTKLTQE